MFIVRADAMVIPPYPRLDRSANDPFVPDNIFNSFVFAGDQRIDNRLSITFILRIVGNIDSRYHTNISIYNLRIMILVGVCMMFITNGAIAVRVAMRSILINLISEYQQNLCDTPYHVIYPPD